MTTSGTTLARLRSPAVLVAQNGASLAIPNYMADEVEQSRASIVAQMVQHSFTRPARPSYASAPQYFPESVEEEPCVLGGDDGGPGGRWSPGPASPAPRGKQHLQSAPLRQRSSDMVAQRSSASRPADVPQPYTTPSSPFRSNTSTSDSAAFSGAAPHSAAQIERSSYPAAFSSERRPLSANANTQAHPARCTAATQPGVDLVAAVTGKIIQQYNYDEDSLDEEELACDLEAAQDTLARALEMARSSTTAVTRMAAPDSPSSRVSAGSSVSRRSHTTQQHQQRGSGSSRHNSTQLQLVELEITPAPSNDGPSSKQPKQQQQYQLPQPRRLSSDAYAPSRETAGAPSPSPGSATGSHPRPWSAGGIPGPSGHSATGARPGSAIFGAGGAGGGILDQRRGPAAAGAAAGQAPGQAGLVTCGSGDLWSLQSTSPLASRATSCLSVAASGSSQVGPGAHGGPGAWLAGSAGSISAQMNQGPSPWFSSAPGPPPRSNVAMSTGAATRGSAGGAGGIRATGPAYGSASADGTAQGAIDAEAGESAAAERTGGIGRFYVGDAGVGATSALAGTPGGPNRSTASASAGSSIKGLFKLAKKAFRRSIGGSSPAAAAAMDAAAATAASREFASADSDGGGPWGASPSPRGGGPLASGGSMVVAGSSVSAVSTRSTRSVGGAVPSAYAAPTSPLLVRPATIVPPPASPPPLSSGPSMTQQQQGYRMSGSTPQPQLPPKLSVQLPEPPSPPAELRGSAPGSGVSGAGSATGAGATLGVKGRLSLDLQSGLSPTLPPPPTAAGCRAAPAPPPPPAAPSACSPTASQASACETVGPVVEGEAGLFARRQHSGASLVVSISAGGGAGGGGGSGGPSPPPASPPGGTPSSWSGASVRRRQSVVGAGAGTASELQVTAHFQSFLQGRQQQQQLLQQMKQQQQGSACDSPASGESAADAPVFTGTASYASSASNGVGDAGGATGQGLAAGVRPGERRGVGGGEQMPESLGHLHTANGAEGTPAAAGHATALGPRPTRLAGAAAAPFTTATPPSPAAPVTGTSPAARSPTAQPSITAAAPHAAAKAPGGPAASPGHLARPAARSSHSAGSAARSSAQAPASAGGSQAGSGAVSPRPPPRTVPGAVTGGAVRGSGAGLGARGPGVPGGRPGGVSAAGGGAASPVV